MSKINKNIITVYALAIIMIFVIGCINIWPMSNPFQPANNTTIIQITNNTFIQNTQFSQEKILKVKETIEAFIRVQYSQNVTLKFNNAKDNGEFVLLNFSDDENRAILIPVSRNLQYIYSNAEELDVFAEKIKQLEAQILQAKQNDSFQIVKSDKPLVEVFVMSYCPYGIQAEKGILPVQNFLKGKADFKIRFVDYIMHPDSGELQENLRQYCIQKEEESKYWEYLSCFVTNINSTLCFSSSKINKTKFDACYNSTDAEYNITNLYNDKSSWIASRYPQFPVEKDLNKQYGVRGSPTFVINGKIANVDAYTPEEIKIAVCKAFNVLPSECNTTLNSTVTTQFGNCRE